MFDGISLYLVVPAVLLLGLALALAGKLIVGLRARLSFSASLVLGMAAAGIGAALANALASTTLGTFLLTALFAVLATVALMLVAERFARPEPVPTSDLIAGGETARCEFKSSARHNLHTGSRDEKIELVVAKTVCGFLNAEGGTLLVGVSDDGEVLGLDDDLRHMKSDDLDRYELWLRDYLSRTLGAAATTSLHVQFPQLAGRTVCRIDVPPSPRPVYLRPTRSDSVQFCVRVGNATRDLPVDQAISYAADHFRRAPGAGRRRTATASARSPQRAGVTVQP